MEETTKPKLHLLPIALMLLIYAIMLLPASAWAITTRNTDVTVPANGNCLLGLDGTFSTAGKAAALDAVNKIRREACNQGVPDPRNPSVKLKSSDYVPVKWSTVLEKIAQTRAAEGSICQDHTRTNGKSCFSMSYKDAVSSSSECLAWNWSGMLDGIEQWHGEKQDWVKQNANAVTGHYTALIDPDITHIGLGAFAPSAGGWTCVAGEFLCSSWYGNTAISEKETGEYGLRRQVIEAPKSSISKLTVKGNLTLQGNASRTYLCRVVARFQDAWGGSNEVVLIPRGKINWKTGSAAVATADASGKVVAKGAGKTNLTASYPASGKKVTVSVKVIPANASISKVVSKKGALQVFWKKPIAMASGVQIRYSTDKSMKNAKSVTIGATKNGKTISKLRSKTKYYVQVRAYANKQYSSWSKAKGYTTK